MEASENKKVAHKVLENIQKAILRKDKCLFNSDLHWMN